MEYPDNYINIPSTREDPMYRYKMPLMEIKIEGAGNGLKTHFVNCNDVAASLKVPPECMNV